MKSLEERLYTAYNELAKDRKLPPVTVMAGQEVWDRLSKWIVKPNKMCLDTNLNPTDFVILVNEQ